MRQTIFILLPLCACFHPDEEEAMFKFNRPDLHQMQREENRQVLESFHGKRGYNEIIIQ